MLCVLVIETITAHFFSYKDPFDEYKTRLAKKLAKRAEAEENAKSQKIPEKKGDDINWFGVRVGTNNAAFGDGATSGGIGKYLKESGGKRRLDEALTERLDGQEKKKKPKIGFSDFDAW